MERKFRGALYGFNRADVTTYIESSACEQREALTALREENARLREEKVGLRGEIAQLQDELASLRAAVLPDPEPAAAPPAREALPAMPDAAEPPAAPVETPPAAPDERERELEAYRRAEAVEREARERASTLCREANDVLNAASLDLGRSSDEADRLVAALRECLGRLEESLSGFRASFDALDPFGNE